MEVEDESFLFDLECPVCKDYLHRPIRQCIVGHSMCGQCCGRVTECPICKDDIETTRNFILENLTEKFKVPCKNKSSGCTIIDFVSKIRVHQEFCQYSEILCPLNQSAKCGWIGNQEDLVMHSRSDHNSQMEFKDNHYSKKMFLPVPYVDRSTRIFNIIDAFNKTFKFGVNINFILNVIQMSVQFVGPRDDSSSYTFRITFIDEWKSVITSTCQPLENNDDDFFYLSGCSLDATPLKDICISNEGLHVQVEILLTNNLYFDSLKRTSRDDLNVELGQPRKRVKLHRDGGNKGSKMHLG